MSDVLPVPSDVLVVAAHPDDEVLGCGGTLAVRHPRDTVHVLLLADGETSADGDRREGAVAVAAARREMARRAAERLGVHAVHFLGLPDQRLDERPLLEILRRAEAALAGIRPRVVYTHSQADLNLDHRIAGQVALTLFRPGAASPVEEILAFAIPGSDADGGQLGRPFQPTVFVDVGAGLERKLRAFEAYTSEVREPPHPRSLEGISRLAAHWGGQAGCAAAEAFELVRRLVRTAPQK